MTRQRLGWSKTTGTLGPQCLGQCHSLLGRSARRLWRPCALGVPRRQPHRREA